MSQYQLISFERLQEVFHDIFNMSLCEGTVFNTNKKGFENLQPFEKLLQESLQLQSLAHADELPIKVGKNLNYLHTLSTPDFTFLNAHPMIKKAKYR
jgi:transposase